MTALRAARAALLATALGVAACEPVERIRDEYRDRTPHEAYLHALSDAGLAQTALVRDWIAASRTAVAQATAVTLPFQEEGFIAPDEAGAAAFRISIPNGQRLDGEVSLVGEDGTRVFVDLFRVPEDPADPLRPVLAVEAVPGTFQYEPWRGGDFILRVQPELLRGGRYRITLRLDAQLAFPVAGVDDRAVWSSWGAARDGGRRSHQGIDIFAPRGTPVLATSPGVVNRVQVTNLGGKVVWVRDAVRNANLYFAHLDSQHVASGARVQVGDTLGFVGNTGNARTTPPHLHFGIYRRGEGAVDPLPFLRRPRRTLAPLTADLALLGSWVRLRGDGTSLRAAPDTDGEVSQELARHTALRVLGGSGDWYRVRLPDGGVGYVASRLTEAVDLPVETRVARVGDAVTASPAPGAPLVAAFTPGTALPVLGRFGPWALVRTPEGRTGWMGDAPTLP